MRLSVAGTTMLVLAAFVATACGARSGLRVPTRDASIDVLDVLDVLDARGDARPIDVNRDVLSLCLHIGGSMEADANGGDASMEAPPECTSDGDCVASIMTAPFCNVRARQCVQCRSSDDCSPGLGCAGGTCANPCTGDSCLPGMMCCNGLCIDPQTDRFNCGTCGDHCLAQCLGGSCAAACPGGCPNGGTCCGNGVCRNLQRDPFSCGACGVICPDGSQCLDGACRPMACRPFCAPGQNCCGSTCLNLDYDAQHCGSCTHACAPGEMCNQGVCEARCSSTRCPAGQICCGTDCADTTNDPLNCGACLHVCDLGEACIDSACTPVGAIGAYSVSSSSQPFVDVCEMTGLRLLASTDDEIATVTLPFPFTFFGCNDTAAWVSSNGALGIGSAPSNEYNNICLPNRFALRNTILAFWDDLGMRDGVCTATLGTAGNRSFVVEWRNAYFYSSNTSARLDFEVVLHEGTDEIDVVYQTMESGTEPGRGNGAMATIGVVDAFGAGALQYACNTPIIHAPEAIRFTPR